MVVILMKGGLGNQMFQYARAYALKHKYIYIDFKIFSKKHVQSSEEFTKRDFELTIFKNLNYKIYYPHIKILFSIKFFIAKKIFPKVNVGIKKVTDFDNEVNDIKQFDNIYLDGYFQSEIYFKQIRSDVLRLFTFPSLDSENIDIYGLIISKSNSVSIHVRRGDYTKKIFSDYHGILSIDYYIKSIDYFKNILNNPFFFIFSDDINWCQENFYFLEKNYFLISKNFGNDSWKDMYLMSQCKHNIIANSSFSWWAAWLNNNNDKIVIAPKSWYISEIDNLKSKNNIPDEWIRM